MAYSHVDQNLYNKLNRSDCATNSPDLPDWVKSLTKNTETEKSNLDLERQRTSVDSHQLSQFLFSKDELQKRDRILHVLAGREEFNKAINHYLGPVDKLAFAISRGKCLHQLAVKHYWTDDEYQIAADLISEPDPYGLHASLFLATLREQCSNEQHDRFLEKAERWEIIGCYAQTELGHGSNVRGLETTAVWDNADKTFTIHSPSITAAKWWVGSLSKVANHAIVMAQLIVSGKNLGPHPFLVQIRDLDSHGPLENVHIGDVGPKYGLNTMDNGYLLFNQLNIPHVNMLSRYVYIDPETGSYERRGSPVQAYATMTYVRSVIVQRAGAALARGATISIRYCAVRRQFAEGQDNKELQVLDYSTVQMRLLPVLATVYALHFTGRIMIDMYTTSKRINSEQALSDLHATSCGLKALATTLAAEGLETCRKACGGHGYSSFAGIGSWFADYLPATTWEGDNYMVTQQVARCIMKAARSVLEGKYPSNDTTEILSHYRKTKDTNTALGDIHEDAQLVEAFAWRAAYLSFNALDQVDVQKRPWNSLLVDFWRLSTAHSQFLVVKHFASVISSTKARENLDTSSLDVLRKLFRLFALHTIDSHAFEFLITKTMSLGLLESIRDKLIPQQLSEIRPHAVTLVDAWMFSDWQLDSSLGRYDGKVYDDLFRRASTGNPRNDISYDPCLNSKL